VPVSADPTGPVDLAAVGTRIEALIDACGVDGAGSVARAEELVRALSDLYGAGLARLLELLDDHGRLDDEVLDAIADDRLVSGLLLIHGLHPDDLTTRVHRALDRVRPYLGSHGGDVEVIEITADAVRLRWLGACDGCRGATATLTSAIDAAIRDAAPEIEMIDVAEATAAPHDAPDGGSVIAIETLRVRLDGAGAGAHVP
jgi:Fe-S cluster biogenesis protein NfuA